MRSAKQVCEVNMKNMRLDSDHLARERRLLALLGLICFALLGCAVAIQYLANEDPCPLCIIQRYLYLLLALCAFAGATVRSWGAIRLFEVIGLLVAVAGASTAVRHVYVLANPGFNCGFDALEPIVNSLAPAHWVPGVFKVFGLCETPYPPILYLSQPVWSLVGFMLAALSLCRSVWCNRDRSLHGE